jgi:plastocyanin
MESSTRSRIGLALIIVVIVGVGGYALYRVLHTDSTSTASVVTTTLPPADKPVPINMQDFAFDPTSRTVKVGTEIQTTNLDDAKHTFTSGVRDHPDGVFNFTVESGVTVSVVMDKAGTVPFYCNIHPGMKGTIDVTS